MTEENFQAYEVPEDAGYEADDIGPIDYEEPYEGEGYDYAEDPFESLRDEYGDIDEDKLMALAESMRDVHNEQAQVASHLSDRELQQVAQELENQHPVLRDESGVYAMLDSAAELLGYEGDPQDLLEYTVANPQLVEDAVEHMEGAGIFQRLWAQQQHEGHKFWGSGHSGSYAG